MSEQATWVIEGRQIERVDRPLDGLYAFSLTSPGGQRVLLLASGHGRATPARWLASERPRGEPADASVRGLRERLEGARIVRTWATRSEVGFEARREEITWRLRADRCGVRCDPAGEGPGPEGDPWGALAEIEGEAAASEQRERLAAEARAQAAATLRRARERLSRRAAAVEGDLRAVEEAEARATWASLFVPAAASARPGQAELRATDWSSGEEREAVFPLAPDRPAREQLAAVFARSKRLRAGAASAARRRDEALLGAMMIDDALGALGASSDAASVRALLAGLAAELPGDARLVAPSAQRGARRPEGGARPFRRYESAGGRPILVGRDAASNDELTLHVARPHDLWVHARGVAGSHVVVPGWEVGAAEVLLDAATLAAHFSAARGEQACEVQYAERRHVRKRRGSAPGAVEVTAEKVLVLRAEPARLARLLATCDRDL